MPANFVWNSSEESGAAPQSCSYALPKHVIDGRSMKSDSSSRSNGSVMRSTPIFSVTLAQIPAGIYERQSLPHTVNKRFCSQWRTASSNRETIVYPYSRLVKAMSSFTR
jgi:hypothetical protein